MSSRTAAAPPDLQRLQDRVDELEQERARLLGLIGLLRDVTGAEHYQDIVQATVRRLGHLFGLDRCSVLLTTRGRGGGVHLVATYEDPSVRHHVVDVNRYPELRTALQTGSLVHIPDALAEPMLAPAAPHLAMRRVQSITVVPMSWQGNVIGALFLRTYQGGPRFTQDDVEFCRVAAEVTARALHFAHRLERAQARAGGPALLAADRERAALLAFVHRLLAAAVDRWPVDEILARASGPELDRLVGVALGAISREAGGS
jgi:two-component system cell cycle response regulator